SVGSRFLSAAINGNESEDTGIGPVTLGTAVTSLFAGRAPCAAAFPEPITVAAPTSRQATCFLKRPFIPFLLAPKPQSPEPRASMHRSSDHSVTIVMISTIGPAM